MEFHSFFSLISGILALVFNVCLIPVILKYSSSKIGIYKYLLLLCTLTAFFYGVAQVTTLPTFHLFERGYVFHATIQLLPTALSLVLLAVFPTCFVANMVVVSLSFLYRYSVLCRQRSNLDKWFQRGWKLYLLITVALSAVCIPAFSILNIAFFHPTTSIAAEVSSEYSSVAHYVRIIHMPDGSINFKLTDSNLFYLLVTAVTTGINVWCVVWMLKEIRKAPGATRNRFEKRILTLLVLQVIEKGTIERVLQAALPILFNVTPLFIVYGMAFCESDQEIIPEYMTAIMTLAQVIDPVLVFVFVNDYNRNVRKLFGFKVHKINSSVHSAQEDCTGSRY